MSQSELARATLAGGCFWCLEAAFEQLDGVRSVLPGYMGGHTPAPSYEAVCGGDTGHAEVVQIEFEPAKISYETLLTVFFTIHDPTTANRQGHDVGSQYRSAIFYHDEAQRAQAQAMIARLNGEGVWAATIVTELAPATIVTELAPATSFFVAETYHHQYFRKNPQQGYCMAVVGPKARKVRQVFGDLLRPQNA